MTNGSFDLVTICKDHHLLHNMQKWQSLFANAKLKVCATKMSASHFSNEMQLHM